MSLFTPQQVLDLAAERYQSRHFMEAELLYRQVLLAHPENADVLHMLGLVARETGRLSEALALMQRSVAAAPGVPEFHNNLGLLLADCDRLEESAVALETACRLAPHGSTWCFNLGNTRRRQRQWDAAITAYREAIEIRPTHPQSWLNLGLSLVSAGQLDTAVQTYHAALQHHPRDLPLRVNLGTLLQGLGRLDEAFQEFEAALGLSPDDPTALNNLGLLYKDGGESGKAIAFLRQSLAKYAHAEVHSNLIYALHLDPATRPEMIADEQRRWNALHAAPVRGSRQALPHERSPERRLRVGYVSADFREHVVGRTLLPVFTAHDPAAVECVCYSTGAGTDAVTERFRARADLWRDAAGWPDARLADQILIDRIDILVDLSLHTAGNRLPTFARRPAPVQVSWLGYPESSGLETIDYWLADPFLCPPETPASEEMGYPYRLPEVWCCYPAPADSPAVGELPFTRHGHITFGSFNHSGKVNRRVLDLWARILAAVPRSRLLLLAKQGRHRERLKAHLQECGVAPERVEFLDFEPLASRAGAAHYLQRYHRVDIALDTFPYNGMTTTGDALWMGVPVVALRGRDGLSRASFSLLANIGLPELAAESEEEYVQCAITLAENPRRLTELRAALRDRMQKSPLLDGPHLARHVEAAFRQMWRRWCE